MGKILLTSFGLIISTLVFAQKNPNESKIDSAFLQSFYAQSNRIDAIINELKEDEKANAYWIAYAQFYSSIFCANSYQQEKAKEYANDAISLLESIDDKNSEEHALLGYILAYSTSFEPAAAARISAKALTQYKAALKKDESNMRAYLGMGQSDFYKPVEYGGGEEVEEYLLKAISLPDQSVANGPSWGKNSAYYTLSSYYKREGEMDKAKMYCMKGLDEFPQDYMLNQLKQSL